MAFTNPIFHLRGDSLNARVSQSGKTPAQLLSDVGTSAVVVSADAGSGVFGSTVLTKASGTKVRALAFPGFGNVSGNAAFSMLMRLVPRWTGAPAFETGLYFAEGISPGASAQGRSISISTAGKLTINLRDKYGTAYFNGVTSAGYTSFVSGTAVDILFVWDGTTSAGTFYVNGTSIGTITPAAGSPVMDANLLGGLYVGMNSTGVLGNYDINEFAIWNAALSGSDITGLSARATFIASTAFDGTSYTDPGITNVKTGTAYTFAGVAESGTYDGSDRWTDPGVANVRFGTAYKANSTSNNETGTCAVPTAANVRSGIPTDATSGNVVVPSTGDVRIGVTFDSNSGLTGTYNGSDLWSDPGFANVKHGVSYKANSMTNNETGTYIGNDEFSDPGIANVLEGVTYLSNGVLVTGTLQLLTNTMSQLQLKQNPSIGQALVMTQGDAFTFDFLAIDDTGSPFDLTGATFSTRMLQEDGSNLVIPSSQHTPNPDQSGHKGEFTMFINGTSTLKTGTTRTIITTVTVNSDVLQFRGTINVLPAKIS